jgi:hypothetical protein
MYLNKQSYEFPQTFLHNRYVFRQITSASPSPLYLENIGSAPPEKSKEMKHTKQRKSLKTWPSYESKFMLCTARERIYDHYLEVWSSATCYQTLWLSSVVSVPIYINTAKYSNITECKQRPGCRLNLMRILLRINQRGLYKINVLIDRSLF